MLKKLIILGLLSIGILSCEENTLEITQDGEINDARVFTNVANMQLYLNEVYDRVTTQGDILASSLLSDEVAIGNSGFPDDTQRFFVLTTNGRAANIWTAHYQAINYCNRLIRGASLFTPTAGAETTEYNNILAQTRALRAFCHFQLLTYFSTDLSNDNAPGVMVLDFVPTTLQKVPRSTNGQVFTFIENDLTYAQANLTTSTTGTNNWRFVNINMVNALRARMYLYRKNYPLAEQYADLLINSSGITLANCLFTLPANFPATAGVPVPLSAAQNSSLGLMEGPTITTGSPRYRKMWTDQEQGEAIFSLTRANNNANFGSQYNTNQSNLSGGPLYDMGRNLFTLLSQPLGGGAEDFRRWSFIDRTSIYAANPSTATKTNDVIVIDKYCGKNGNAGSNDLKVFRISEMYFIKAECRVNASDFIGAANAIRTVRQARNYVASGIVPLPSYSSTQIALEDILLERRKELCFEGHRYVDLKRLGAPAGVTGTDRFNQDAVNSSAISPANILIGDYRFTMPIPQAEINVNPLQQNPGY
jgi:starch-binding outer membrane protein, SusD/RagB family